MQELIALGTGNALATRYYNTCFAFAAAGEYFLVDAGGGNGILSRLEGAGIPLTALHHCFVTHNHSDHILGIPWVVRAIATAMRQGKYEGNFHLYCHDKTEAAIRTICGLVLQKKFTALFDERILFHRVEDGESCEILGAQVTFFDLLSTKEKQFGMKIACSDGRTIAFFGDEPIAPAREGYAQNADWLFTEAFCLWSEREKFHPYEKHHSTVADACRLAKRLGAKQLVLWHTEDASAPERKKRYLAEGSPLFSGRLWVPDDGERISLIEG